MSLSARKWRRATSLFFVLFAALCRISSSQAEGLQYPLSVAAIDSKAIWVADRELPGVWRIADGVASVILQSSKKTRTPLNAIRCLAIDREGRLLAGDSATRQIYRFADGAQPIPLITGGLGIPMDIGVLDNGDLLVCDLETSAIWAVEAQGGKPTLYAKVAAPRAIYAQSDDRIWIVSHGANQVLLGNRKGKFQAIVAGQPFRFPSDIVVDRAGTAYICDTYAKAIWRLSPGNAPEKWVEGSPLVSPVGLSWQGEDLLVADPRARSVIRVSPEGAMSVVKTSFTRQTKQAKDE